jgi:hypothetical protein
MASLSIFTAILWPFSTYILWLLVIFSPFCYVVCIFKIWHPALHIGCSRLSSALKFASIKDEISKFYLLFLALSA